MCKYRDLALTVCPRAVQCRYWKHQAYMIDVSQSVEHDHPRALEFLRKDCTNITDFFEKKGVAVMTVRELFDFITDVTLTKDTVDDYLDKVRWRLYSPPGVEEEAARRVRGRA